VPHTGQARLDAAVSELPELIKRQEALGITVMTDGRLAPAERRKFFHGEVNRWTKTIKDTRVQPE
jgi:hypothetical protein